MHTLRPWSFVGFALFTAACAAPSADGAPANEAEGPDTVEDVNEVNSGRVSLRIPIVDENGKPLSRYNPKLAAAGLPLYPDVVEVAGGPTGAMVKGGDKEWDRVQGLGDRVSEKLDIDVQQEDYGEPYNFKTNDPATTLCYRGSGKLVAALVESLGGRVFSDQLSIHGWRYRQIKGLPDGFEPEFEESFPAIWRNWRGRGDAVLMLTASSDDGSEINVSLIPKCP